LLENGVSSKIAAALKQIGYAHVTLDLQGYRRGSLNESNSGSKFSVSSQVVGAKT
jgi:uncharacterized protein